MTTGSVWKGSLASEAHCNGCTSIWYQHRPAFSALVNRTDSIGSVVGVIPANSQHPGSRVTTSTGLGLPLCRSLAVASGGWVGLEDLDSSPSQTSLLTPTISGFTQFWCAIACQGRPSTAASTVPPSYASDAKDDSVLEVRNVSGSACAPPLPSPPTPVTVDSAPQATAVSTSRTGILHSATEDKSSSAALGPGSLSDVTVFVSIPAAAPSPSVAATRFTRVGSADVVVDISSLQFLFVDDEAPNRRIGSRYLSQLKVPPAQITLLSDGMLSAPCPVMLFKFIRSTSSGSPVCNISGPSALEFLSNPSNRESVDVVFLDIMMPGLSGIQVLEQLTSRPSECVIIACTGSVEASTIVELR